MAISLRKPKDTAEYILEREREEENPATFIVGRPPASELVKLRDMAFDLTGDTARPSSRYQEACLQAVTKNLKGWRNINDGSTDVPFPKNARLAVDQMDMADVNEIGTAIILGEMFEPEQMTEADRKNSE